MKNPHQAGDQVVRCAQCKKIIEGARLPDKLQVIFCSRFCHTRYKETKEKKNED